jgi:carbon-monoxide dehydrogenase small subunit
MEKVGLTFTVNGEEKKVVTDPHRTLLKVLREDLDLNSVKEGCAQGDCGACMVVMDGLAVNSCLVLAAQAQGAEIITIEGLEQHGELHPLQKMFIEKWAFQCGFCTPGMLMSAYALLLHNPDPTAEEIRDAISGNLCRCTGYQAIIEAVRAAVEMQGDRAWE